MTRDERRDSGRFLKRHGFKRKEDVPSRAEVIGSRIKEGIQRRYAEAQERRRFKKSPAGQREEVKRLRLEAQKEAAKTSIHKSKRARRSDMFGGTQPRSTGRRRTRSIQPRQSSGMGIFEDNYSSGYSGSSFGGMDSLFGGGAQQPTRRKKKQPKQHSGMDDLF